MILRYKNYLEAGSKQLLLHSISRTFVVINPTAQSTIIIKRLSIIAVVIRMKMKRTLAQMDIDLKYFAWLIQTVEVGLRLSI